jgi:hypothetical protein
MWSFECSSTVRTRCFQVTDESVFLISSAHSLTSYKEVVTVGGVKAFNEIDDRNVVILLVCN